MNRKLRSIVGTLEQADRGLLLAVGVLIFLGSIVVFGAGTYAYRLHRSPLGTWYMVIKHLAMVGAGAAAMLVLMHFDYRRYRLPVVNLAALVVTYGLVAVTLVTSRGGDEVINRWIVVGGFTIQPVEFAKIAMIMFLAERLTRVRRGVRLATRQIVLALALGPLPLIVLLVKQPNFGNAMVAYGVTLAILYVAGVDRQWLRGGLAAAPIAGIAGYLLSTKVHDRVQALIGGHLRGESFGYQVDQGLTGMGAGGVLGFGPGQSQNKFNFLPESHTDFAFSVLGEELGLIGSLVVIAMLVLFAWRGYGIASRSNSAFGRALATGLTTGIVIYGVANIAMVTALFPVVGVPLPFVSYGGTAMITALAAVGILLNIDRDSRSYHQWRHRWDREGAA
jgi:cell division protein FtsW